MNTTVHIHFSIILLVSYIAQQNKAFTYEKELKNEYHITNEDHVQTFTTSNYTENKNNDIHRVSNKYYGERDFVGDINYYDSDEKAPVVARYTTTMDSDNTTGVLWKTKEDYRDLDLWLIRILVNGTLKEVSS